MIVTRNLSVLGILAWQWQKALLFCGAAVVAQTSHVVLDWDHLVVPTMPLSVVGAALGIFASFRTNACYQRWWEGRGLWGRLINTSRHLSSQAVSNLSPDEARTLVRRQAAYAHVLRCALREQNPWTDPDVIELSDAAERERWGAEKNPCFAVQHDHRVQLTRLADAGALHEQRFAMMDHSLGSILDVQGGCERLKKTPFPQGYGFVADRLIVAYGVLLPFGLVKDLGWVTVPMNLLVCGAFALISEAGRVLEDPFSTFWNGLPLTAMARTIEVNLRQRLGETEVPAIPGPDSNGVLM